MDKARLIQFPYFCSSSLCNFSIVSTDFIQLCKSINFGGLRWLCAKKRKPHISVPYSGLDELILTLAKSLSVWNRYLLFYCAKPKLKKVLE